jgi:hypothetical protein
MAIEFRSRVAHYSDKKGTSTTKKGRKGPPAKRNSFRNCLSSLFCHYGRTGSAHPQRRISSVATRGFIGNLSDRGHLADALALYMKPPDTPWCSAWTRRPASRHLTGHSRCYRCGLLSRVVGPTNMYAMGRARFWPAWILPPEKSSLMCVRGAKGLP